MASRLIDKFVSFHILLYSFPPSDVAVPTVKLGGSELSIITLVLSVVSRTVTPSILFASVKSIANSTGPSGSEFWTIYVAVHLFPPPYETLLILPFICTTGSLLKSEFEVISIETSSPTIPVCELLLDEDIETIFNFGALTTSILSINQSSI